MKLKNIILLMLFIALSSCAKQELGDNPNGGIPTDEVRINYSLPVATVVETRSDKTVDEATVSSMHILVFEDKDGVADKFVEIKEATIATDGTSTAKLSSSDGAKHHVRILANAQTIIDVALAINSDLFNPATATWISVSSALLVGTISTDGSGKPTSALPSTPLPMMSDDVMLNKIEPGITDVGTTAEPVVLKSGYAKVTLQSTDAKLAVTGVALHNAPAVGGTIFTTVIPTSATRANYHKANGFVFGTTQNYLFPTTVDASVDAPKIDLIIKGHFDGETDATYYRISLSKPATGGTREYFNIQANYHYAVTLTSVGVHGYPTIEEAINNPYSNIIYDTDTEMGDNNGMASNGQYCMKITNTNYEVTTTGAGVVLSKLTTDAPTTAQRSVHIISSVSDGEFLIKDVAIGADGNITATTADIGGTAIVRVAVGNLSQDITITNEDKSHVVLEHNYLGELKCTTDSPADIAVIASDVSKVKVEIARADKITTISLQAIGITAAKNEDTDAYAALTIKHRNLIWKVKISYQALWAKGNIVFDNGRYAIGKPEQEGLYFKTGSYIGMVRQTYDNNIRGLIQWGVTNTYYDFSGTEDKYQLVAKTGKKFIDIPFNNAVDGSYGNDPCKLIKDPKNIGWHNPSKDEFATLDVAMDDNRLIKNEYYTFFNDMVRIYQHGYIDGGAGGMLWGYHAGGWLRSTTFSHNIGTAILPDSRRFRYCVSNVNDMWQGESAPSSLVHAGSNHAGNVRCIRNKQK